MTVSSRDHARIGTRGRRRGGTRERTGGGCNGEHVAGRYGVSGRGRGWNSRAKHASAGILLRLLSIVMIGSVVARNTVAVDGRLSRHRGQRRGTLVRHRQARAGVGRRKRGVKGCIITLSGRSSSSGSSNGGKGRVVVAIDLVSMRPCCDSIGIARRLINHVGASRTVGGHSR